jgi:hypothetical protein
VDFEPRDVTAPRCARGWDIIFQVQHLAYRAADKDTRIAYEQAAAKLIPALSYEMSLDATPDYRITRWSPPAGRNLASVIIYESAHGGASVAMTY